MEGTYIFNVRDNTRESWLQARMHGPAGDIPVTLGGSEVGLIMEDDEGFVSQVRALPRNGRYSSRQELWMQKRKEYERVNDAAKTLCSSAIRDGVFNEEYVCRRYEDQIGNSVLRTPGMYQHATEKFALGDPDAFVLFDDAANAPLPYPISQIERGLECKTTDVENNRSGIRLWRMGIPPFEYVCQCLHYMWVVGVPKWDLMCVWGIRESDYALLHYERDAKAEEILAENEYAFVQSVIRNEPPPLPIGRDYLLRVVKEQYKASHANSQRVRFVPERHRDLLKNYASISAEISKKEKEIRELEGRRSAAEAFIRLCMKDSEQGYMQDGKMSYSISCKTQTRSFVDAKRLQTEQPAIYEEYKSPIVTRPLRVRVTERR